MDMNQIAQFATRLEAETAASVLEQHDIPHTVKLDDAGGMIALAPTGASLWVSAEREAEARELLAGMWSGASDDDAIDGE